MFVEMALCVIGNVPSQPAAADSFDQRDAHFLGRSIRKERLCGAERLNERLGLGLETVDLGSLQYALTQITVRATKGAPPRLGIRSRPPRQRPVPWLLAGFQPSIRADLTWSDALRG